MRPRPEWAAEYGASTETLTLNLYRIWLIEEARWFEAATKATLHFQIGLRRTLLPASGLRVVFTGKLLEHARQNANLFINTRCT